MTSPTFKPVNIPFGSLLGKTLIEIEGRQGDEDLLFLASDGSKYWLGHEQDCCEAVRVEEIIGDLEDLIGSPILLAEDIHHENMAIPEEVESYNYDDSFTWTFYKLSTLKGSVTIRFLGESNGYYSEAVDFIMIKPPVLPKWTL